MPQGLVGLLMAVIVLASMSSTASELSALGSTSVVDLYRRLLRPEADERHTVLAGRAFTVLWGAVAIAFATFASTVDNLIQAVNVLGSIFYGVILGIFLVALFLRRVGANAVLIGAAVAQLAVVAAYLASDIGFLWFNVIGCALVVAVAVVAQAAGNLRAGPSTRESP
jgi:Na+/proline symporter